MTKEASKPIQSLGNFGSLRTQDKTYKMSDIMGVPVIVVDFELAEGDYGEFAWLTVLTEDEDRKKVRCGGTFILEALKEAKEAGALPVSATFILRGKAWVVE